MAKAKTAPARIIYGGITFEMVLPCRYVTDLTGAEQPAFGYYEIAKLEASAARYVIEHGIATPDTIRLFRSVAGLTQSQLGELFGTDKSRISEWENGRAGFSLATWSAVAALAVDAMTGRTETADRLRAAQAPREPKGMTVKLAS